MFDSNTDVFTKRFSEKLKELRKEKKMTQTALAEAIGRSQATIASYEKGSVSPSIDVATKIAQVLGVSIAKMVEESGDLAQSRKTYSYIDSMTRIAEICDIENDYGTFFIQAAIPPGSYSEQEDIDEDNYAKTMEEEGIVYEGRSSHAWFIGFKNIYIAEFLKKLQLYRDLLKNGAMERHVYHLWINDYIYRATQEYENLQAKWKNNV